MSLRALNQAQPQQASTIHQQQRAAKLSKTKRKHKARYKYITQTCSKKAWACVCVCGAYVKEYVVLDMIKIKLYLLNPNLQFVRLLIHFMLKPFYDVTIFIIRHGLKILRALYKDYSIFVFFMTFKGNQKYKIIINIIV